MSFELDDAWINDVKGLNSFTQIEKRRIYRIIMVLAGGVSYLLDTLFLSLFSAAGTVDSHVVFVYGGLALGHIILFSSLHWIGFGERFSNPHMTVWQMSYAIAVQLIGIAIATELVQFFLGIMFVIFAFAMLRVAMRQAMVMWFVACVAVAIVMGILPQSNFGIMAPRRFEMIVVWISFTMILLRVIALGYYATALRMKIFEKSLALEAAAIYDSLTGVLNRQAIFPAITDQISLNQRKGQINSIAMVDIDKFKMINDTHGHVAGDAVLKKLAKHVSQRIRKYDKLGRYGGEEFIMLLPATSVEEAESLMECIRKEIEGLSFDEIASDLQISISCGITEILPDDSVEKAIGRADGALYEAKAAGRNRVCVVKS